MELEKWTVMAECRDLGKKDAVFVQKMKTCDRQGDVERGIS